MKKAFGLFLLFGCCQALATPVLWTLDGVVLEDTFQSGSTYYADLTGSFVYDADTDSYSDISIFAEASGTQLWSFSLEYPNSSTVLSASATNLTVTPWIGPGSCGFDFCGRTLYLAFASALTNSGGAVALDTSSPGSYENYYSYASGYTDNRDIISGTLVGTVVPIPAAVWLFGSALTLIGISRRKIVAP